MRSLCNIQKKQIVILFFFIFLACILYSNHMHAENGKIINIYGQVQDESGNPVSGVKIYLCNEKTPIVETDENGIYSVWISSQDEGNLKYEYSNQEIKSIDSKKITYKNSYNIKVVYSLPNEDSKYIYEDILNRKLYQIVTDSGKEYEYAGSVVDGTNVIEEAEDKLAPLNKASQKRIHISYTDENMAIEMIEALADKTRKLERRYELFINPIDDKVKKMFEDEVQSVILSRPILDPKTLNAMTATETLKAICDQHTTITRNEEKDSIGFSNNQTDTFSMNEDRELNIIMRNINENYNENQEQSSNSSIVNTGLGGTNEIHGQTKDEQENAISLVRVILKKDGLDVAEARTDENGNYSFTGVETGYYYVVEFIYGDETQLTKNIKYNGQDYETLDGKISVIKTEENTTITTEYINMQSTGSYAKDDQTRRDSVNKNGQNVDYNHFINYIVNDSISNLSTVSENTWMSATGEVDLRDNTDNIKIVRGVDLVLKEREKARIKIEKKIEDIKLKLPDESYLISKSDALGKDYILDLGGAQQMITMDEEIMHGSSIQITYGIYLYNDYSEEIKVKLYDYIAKELHFMTKDMENNNINNNWHISSSLIINPTMKNKILNSGRTVVESDEIIIPAEGSTKTEIILRKVITSGEMYEYNNDVEIGFYTNDQGRRIFVSGDVGAIPGSFVVEDNTTIEEDTAQAPLLSIVPPFGGTCFDTIKTKETIQSNLNLLKRWFVYEKENSYNNNNYSSSNFRNKHFIFQFVK